METPTQSASPPKPKPRGRKQRSRQHREPFASDREAVRAVLSADAFREVEELRRQYPKGIEHDIFFWQAARVQLVRRALRHPNGALRLMRAKIGAVGAMLTLTSSEIDALLAQVNFHGFVAGALANQCILEFQRDSRLDGLWTEPTLRANPPLRVEFEHAVVLGTINDAGDIAKHKSWGKLIALQPLAVDDRLYPRNITYMLKATSKLRMRWEFRDNFRQLLGPKRSLVSVRRACCDARPTLQWLTNKRAMYAPRHGPADDPGRSSMQWERSPISASTQISDGTAFSGCERDKTRRAACLSIRVST